MNTTVLFTRAGSTYTVQFAYSAALVELLKATVPAYARRWNKATKQWTVDDAWCQPLAAALRGIGCTVIGLDDCTRQQPHDGMAWAQALFRAVGKHRTAAVHRALTKVLHPDNTETGSHELQQQLNDARKEVTA